VDTVDFLGYVVSTSGVTMSVKKVDCIKQWKPPTSVKEVQIFMGFANFYRRFIKNFSRICQPITDTLRTASGQKFKWGKPQDEAFEE